MNATVFGGCVYVVFMMAPIANLLFVFAEYQDREYGKAECLVVDSGISTKSNECLCSCPRQAPVPLDDSHYDPFALLLNVLANYQASCFDSCLGAYCQDVNCDIR